MLKKQKPANNANINNARILYYDFFGTLFTHDLLRAREELLLRQVALLSCEPLDDKNAKSFSVLENELKAHRTQNLIIEYTSLFMLPFSTKQEFIPTKKRKTRPNPQVILYLSYYLDKTIAGEGLVIARSLVKKSKMRLNEKYFCENEEHFGFLLLFAKHCLQNEDSALFSEVFNRCIKVMKGHVVRGINNRQDSHFYRHIAVILEGFLEFECALCQP